MYVSFAVWQFRWVMYTLRCNCNVCVLRLFFSVCTLLACRGCDMCDTVLCAFSVLLTFLCIKPPNPTSASLIPCSSFVWRTEQTTTSRERKVTKLPLPQNLYHFQSEQVQLATRPSRKISRWEILHREWILLFRKLRIFLKAALFSNQTYGNFYLE